ncbi:MAG: MotA/TolQ/ExbB proton channel family protein [Phycisphaeraceae bacterium]|nr:MotA/TolQ/ExbB proton channel family protein [Phycisphaeraceae bacterium]
MKRLYAARWTLAALIAAMGFLVPHMAMAEEEAANGEAAATEEAVPAALETEAATTLRDRWESLVVDWHTGGVTMYFLAFMAAVALVFSIERLISLQRRNIAPKGLADRVNRLWQSGDYAGIVRQGRNSRSTLGEVVSFLAEHRGNTYEHLTTAAEDIASRDMEQHSRRVYPLIAVGTMAPLLGLLGTVFGLTGAFRTIEVVGSMDEPSALAGDIGKALITTATGLIIALPALALYHYFRSRTSHFANLLGQEITTLMHTWFLSRGTDGPSSGAAVPPAAPATARPATPAPQGGKA